MKKMFFPLTIGIAISLLLLGGMWFLFQRGTAEIDLREGGTQKKYERHYVMIAEDTRSSLWQEIYKSAAEEAEESNVYLELMNSDAMQEYSLEDSLRISIASRVDGIIMQPNGSLPGRELIREAAENGIPVVAALEDDSDSERVSFVGMNSYQMGTAYGEAILKNLPEDKARVLVLLSADKKDTGTSLMVFQLTSEVKKEAPDTEVSLYYVNDSGNFELEEAIRDIFLNQKELPDILVCMDEMITECAYQAVVDYNQVGNVDIIGYYESDTILDSIKKGTIAATISFSTDEIGKYSVEALNEYHSLGHVSNYFNVTLRTVDVGNVVSVMMRKKK